MMDEQIKKYKARFGNRISDNILKLFFEDELYAYVLNHRMARELTCDVFIHVGDLIKKISLIEDEGNLLLAFLHLDYSKKILKSICTCVKECKDSNDEMNIPNVFKKEEWEVFYNKCNTVERYNKEKMLLDNSRQFYAAQRTIMSDDIKNHIECVIDKGYRSIWKEEIGADELYKIQLYKSILVLWNKRLNEYGKNLIRIRKIIYKGN